MHISTELQQRNLSCTSKDKLKGIAHEMMRAQHDFQPHYCNTTSVAQRDEFLHDPEIGLLAEGFNLLM